MRSDGRGQVSGDKFRARPGQPFGTASDYAPTNKDLSSQIGSLSAQVTGQATILGQRIDGLEEKMDARFTVVQSELLLLRTVTADHVPRISAVEKTTVGKIKGVAGWVGVASLVVTIAAQIAATFKPSMVGPIQAIGQMLAGLQ